MLWKQFYTLDLHWFLAYQSARYVANQGGKVMIKKSSVLEVEAVCGEWAVRPPKQQVQWILLQNFHFVIEILTESPRLKIRISQIDVQHIIAFHKCSFACESENRVVGNVDWNNLQHLVWIAEERPHQSPTASHHNSSEPILSALNISRIRFFPCWYDHGWPRDNRRKFISIRIHQVFRENLRQCVSVRITFHESANENRNNYSRLFTFPGRQVATK